MGCPTAFAESRILIAPSTSCFSVYFQKWSWPWIFIIPFIHEVAGLPRMLLFSGTYSSALLYHLLSTMRGTYPYQIYCLISIISEVLEILFVFLLISKFLISSVLDIRHVLRKFIPTVSNSYFSVVSLMIR